MASGGHLLLQFKLPARRYWEHLIRDEADYRLHMDYVYINRLKHGLVKELRNWPYSTFHRVAQQGIYPGDWAACEDGELSYAD